MSNPGVITLASLNDSSYIDFPYRFCIEDNIGEAIHVHFKDIRLDLSVVEFLNFADEIERIMEQMIDVQGFKIAEFDPVHLVSFIPNLYKIARIESAELKLSELFVDTYDASGAPTLAHIQESRVYKALNGCKQEDAIRDQINYFERGSAQIISNEQRIMFCLEKIKREGYPYDNSYIMLDNCNTVIDGQHRAAVLYYLYGDITVKVHRLVLKDEPEHAEKRDILQIEKPVRHVSWKGKAKAGIKRFLWRSWFSEELGDQMIMEQLDGVKTDVTELCSRNVGLENEIKELKKLIVKYLVR